MRSETKFVLRLGFRKIWYLELYWKSRRKIADLKRSRDPLKVCRRNPAENNYTSRNLIFPKKWKILKNIFFWKSEKIFFFQNFSKWKEFINEIWFWKSKLWKTEMFDDFLKDFTSRKFLIFLYFFVCFNFSKQIICSGIPSADF